MSDSSTPYPPAPKGLILDDCTVSGDQGANRATMAAFAKNVDALGGQVADANQNANQALQDASNALQTAESANELANSVAEKALPKSAVAIPEFDQVPGMFKGNVQGATSSWNHPLVGQGYQQTWNDPSGRGGTSHININPGAVGGHWFYDHGTGQQTLNTDMWGMSILTSWGYVHVGRPDKEAVIYHGRPSVNHWPRLAFYSAQTSYMVGGNQYDAESGDVGLVARGGTGTAQDGGLYLGASVFGVKNDSVTDIGETDKRFKDIYISGKVNELSDLKAKTVVQDILDSQNPDREKLLAFYDMLSPKLFTLNSEDKDTAKSGKLHVGVIAQEVKAAFEKAALDPNKFILWSAYYPSDTVEVREEATRDQEIVDPETKEKKIIQVPYTKVHYEKRPVLDESGQQLEMQSLVYMDLAMLMLACERLKREALEQKQADLEKRLEALEVAQNGK